MTLWIGEAHLVDHVKAFNGIVVRYYASTEASEGVPQIDFGSDMYLGLEKLGGTLFMTALDGGRLVGGCLYVVGPHPHHRTVTIAGCDTLAVDTACRCWPPAASESSATGSGIAMPGRSRCSPPSGMPRPRRSTSKRSAVVESYPQMGSGADGQSRVEPRSPCVGGGEPGA